MAGKASPSKVKRKRIRPYRPRDPAKKKLECSECGRKFHFISELKFHFYTHTGEKPYQCDVCDKAFNTPYSLKTHKLIHTDEKPYKCSFCDYACRDSSTLRKHQERHGGKKTYYQCKTCDKTFSKKWLLKNHVAEIHLNINTRTIPCNFCDKKFKSNSNLNFHIKAFHKRALAGHCPVCNIYLANMRNLPIHLTTHVDARPFVCNVPGCGKSYKDKGTLKKHMVCHQPDRQYECEICQRVFLRKERVKRHIITVHGKRKCVECDYCGVKFFSKAYLINHITKKHTKRRKFKYICDICGLKTYNKPSIVMHLKYGHLNDDDLECKICRTVYKKHIYLKQHYKMTHSIAYKTKTRETNHLIIKEEPPDEDNISTASIDLFEIEKTESELTELLREIPESMPELPEPFPEVPVSLPEMPDTLPEVDENQTGLPELKTFIECEKIADIPQDMFERFYVQTFQRNTLEDTEPKEAQANQDYNIDEKALELQNNAKTKMLEEAKKRAIIEAAERAKIQAELRKKEAVKAVERARLLYNERMRNYVDKLASQEKKPIKIKMFQTKRTKVPKDNKCSVVDEKSQTTADTDKDTKELDNVTELVNKNVPNGDEERKKDCDRTDIDDNKAIICDNNEKAIETKDNEMKEDSKIDRINGDNDNIGVENVNCAINSESDEIGNDDEIDENGKGLSVAINNKNDEIGNDDEIDENCKELSAEGDATSADDDDDEEWISKSKTIKKNKKMNFNSHQCYICFKLYDTKEKLLDHCKNHFDVCNDRTLKKCPLCPYVSDKFVRRHLKYVHKVNLKIPYTNIQDKKDNSDGCRYYVEVNDPNIQKIEVIPSVKNLNKLASMKIDKKNREDKCKTLAKTKLVRKGKEWIVETEKITVDKDVIMPKFDSDAIKNITDKIGDSDAYLDSLKKMYHLTKKSGKTMLFPCQNCEKVCRNFAALKLHSRKHETNPKPFRKKIWKHKLKPGEDYKRVDTRKKDSTNRTAKPKPIKNKHKCDPELKDFYENNIRGGDIEFWQFLKIFNKMGRDKIKDFKDLEGRHEYGINLGYIPETVEDVNKIENKIDNDEQIPTSSKNNESDEIDKSKKDVPRRKRQTKANKTRKYKKDEKYKRVIRISKEEYNKRNAIRQKLRENISQNSEE